MTGSSAFDAWVDEARAVSLEDALVGRNAALKRSGAEQIGPCPLCGGHDGFSIHPAKRVFNCRRAGVGGDAIALVQHLDGCDFRVACEILTGRPTPGRDGGETAEARAAREAAQAARRARQDEDDALRAEDENRFREAERARCWALWEKGVPLPGTPGEAYLTVRGLIAPPKVLLRCSLAHPYYVFRDAGRGRKEWVAIHRGPALLAPIVGPAGKFAGLHATWIDLARPSGKVELFDAQTGEQLPAKKVRGSATGGRIPLVSQAAPTVLFLGEGIETVLSVWRALDAAGDARLPHAVFWSGYSLGNIGGRAVGSVRHPSEVTVDRLGRRRARMVPGARADFTAPSIPVPAGLRQAILLGDSDSDPTTTQNALARAAARILRQAPGCDVRVAWAPAGEDFNDVLRRAAA